MRMDEGCPVATLRHSATVPTRASPADEMYCTLTVAVSGGAIRAVCFSPDGRRAAFLTNEGRGEGKLYVVSTATGEVLFQHDVQASGQHQGS